MNILKNKTTVYLLVGMTALVFGVVSYLSALAYREYSDMQESVKSSSLLTDIDTLFDALTTERLGSVEYLASDSDNHRQKIDKSRKNVNLALETLRLHLEKSDRFGRLSSKLDLLEKELDILKGQIEAKSSRYQEILFEGYHQKVGSLIVETVSQLSVLERFEASKQYLTIYQTITKLKENTIAENSGIYFFLLTSMKMSDGDIALLQQLIQEDSLPQFGGLQDKDISAKLNALQSDESYLSLLSKEREMILYEAKQGDYSVSTAGWFNQIEKKMTYFGQAQSILIKKIESIENEAADHVKMKAIVLGGVAFLLFLVWLKLIMLASKKRDDAQLSPETLKDIAMIFDTHQQKELQRLIESGKVDYVYRFLIKAIKDANHTKDLFLASMSHEIRTPLNGIVGFTQLLKESEATQEQREFISVIEKSSEHLLSIVNDILDLSKIKAQKIELETIAFDPIVSFENAVESYAAKAAEANIDFNIFLDPKLPTLLMGDPTKISQVIVNLISNAIKFTSKNGEVNVTIETVAEREGETEVMFAVSDTGIGITKEQKEKIFEAFGQADVSTSRKYGGTGLGLSISGKLVTLMGGELKIKSVKDEGSTFYFTLPLKKAPNATARATENLRDLRVGILNPRIESEYFVNKNLEAYITYAGAKIKRYTEESLLSIEDKSQLPDILFVDHKFRHRGDEIEPFVKLDTKVVVLSTGDQKRNLKRYASHINKILYKPVNFSKTLKALSDKADDAEAKRKILFENVHILVAEDNTINQKLILNVLNRLGIEVSFANNGQEALEKRMQKSYEMIFMDIEMPVMGGMEATGKIRAFERNSAQSRTPIVALTANALSGDKEKYISSGMDGYLSKPLQLEALNALLEEYFEEKMVEERG